MLKFDFFFFVVVVDDDDDDDDDESPLKKHISVFPTISSKSKAVKFSCPS